MREVKSSEAHDPGDLSEASLLPPEHSSIFSGDLLSSSIVRQEVIRKVFLSVGTPCPNWWVKHSLQAFKEKTLAEDLPDKILADAIREHSFYLGAYSFQMLEGELPKEFLEVMTVYGYTYDQKNDLFLLDLEKLTPKAPEISCDINEILGSTGEKVFEIPDVRHRTIFDHHMGRGQTSFYEESLAESEGLSDAKCSLSYLKAYNLLIKKPNIANFVKATVQPNISTGPYHRTMSYALEIGLSQEFINLLHVGFYIHWISFTQHFSSPGFVTESQIKRCSVLDLAMFGAVLKKFCDERGASQKKQILVD